MPTQLGRIDTGGSGGGTGDRKVHKQVRRGEYLYYLDAQGNVVDRIYSPQYYGSTNYNNTGMYQSPTAMRAGGTIGPKVPGSGPDLPTLGAASSRSPVRGQQVPTYADAYGPTDDQGMTKMGQESVAAAQAAQNANGGNPGSGDTPAEVYTNAIGGFSGKIPDSQLPNAWNNPEALLRLWANFAGYDESGGAEANLQQFAPSLGIQWMIANDMAGMGGLDPNTGEVAGSRNYVNWMEPFLGAITSPGQTNPLFSNPGAVLQTLLNPQGETLQSYLGAPGGQGAANLTRSDQVDNVINAMRYAMQPNLPTPTLNALLNVASVQGRQYLADELTGQTEGSFVDVLKNALGR